MTMTRWINRRSAVALAAATMATAWTSGVGAQPKMEATLATVNSPAFLLPRTQLLLAQKVAEKTNGGLTIKVVHSGQLGGMKENIEAVMGGSLELTQVNNAFLGVVHPNTMLFDLPFVFRDNDHMRRVVRGDIGRKVYAEYEQKTGMMLVVAGLADGPRSVWNRTRPVRTPADLKGMKLRVMEAPIMVDTFRALGAIPTPMPFPEVYMAAKQGVIDGAETPPSGLPETKVPEIAKYYSLTKHFAMPSAVAANAKWFNGLPESYRNAIREASAEVSVWYDNIYDSDNLKALDQVKKDGMVVNEVDDLQAYRDAVKPVYEKYAERVGGMQMIQAVIDTK